MPLQGDFDWPADFSLCAPRPAPEPQRTGATRPWRPGRPVPGPAGSLTAPCADVSPCSSGWSPGDDTLETIGRPSVRQRLVRLGLPGPDSSTTTLTSGFGSLRRLKRWPATGLKIVLHEPLLNQVALRQGRASFPGHVAAAVPPGASKSKDTRYIDIHEGDVLDEAQLVKWVKQAAALPGFLASGL